MQIHTCQSAIDHLAVWQTGHITAWCHRMSAMITHVACKGNQWWSAQKGGDLRCKGCGGLDNQAAPQSLGIKHSPEWDDSETTTDEPIKGLAALDHIIDGLYEDPAPGDDFDDVELDLDDEELLALFPELADEEDEDTEPGLPRITEYQETAPPRAVYHGRCERCSGKMNNVRERHDDYVFRCLLCGWRDGAEYARNRSIQSAWGIK